MITTMPSDVNIFTDSSKTIGFGAMCADSWFYGTWPSPKWTGLNIAVLELYPVLAVLHVWKGRISDKIITVYSDNQAVAFALNKLYAKDKGMRQILKPIALFCLCHNVSMRACHIAGLSNVGPDLLSRGKIKEFLDHLPAVKRSPEAIPREARPEMFDLEKFN